MDTKLDERTLLALEKIGFEAVNALMYNKAFFSRRDLLRAIDSKLSDELNRHKDKPALIQETIRRMELIPVYPGQPDNEWSQFTTSRMVRLEREMVEMAKATSNAHAIPDQPDAINQLVEAAFASRPTMADEQKAVVLASCVTDKNVIITEGTAGAGKSFSLNAIREIYENVPPRHSGEAKGYDIIGTALSWTATKVLEESAGLSGGMAIEGFVRKMKDAASRGQDFFKRRTVVVVDEAGLAPTELVHQILYYAQKSSQDVRVILTGDSLQLNPVQAGNALELLVEECGSTRLDTIRRQKQASHRQAVKHFCFGRAEKGLYTYHQQEAVHFLSDREALFDRVVGDYVSYTSAFPDKPALVLALKNDDVGLLNTRIRAALKAVGRVEQKGVTFRTYDGKTEKDTEFCIGDQIVFRQNAPKHPVFESEFKKAHEALADAKKTAEEKSSFLGWVKHSFKSEKSGPEIRKGIFNRTIGTILDIRSTAGGGHELRILLTEGGEVRINTKEYLHPEKQAVPLMHNFATTIYASQGQTVPRVMMLDDPNMNRKLAYVGASRHTELLDVYLDCKELGGRIRKKLDRERDKAQAKLDREQSKAKGSLLAEMEGHRLFDQYPDFPETHVFTQREYLGVVSSSWNTPSLNQTVTMARKQRGGRIKRDPHWKSPLAPWYLSMDKAAEDDVEDHPDVRHPLVLPAKIHTQEQTEESKGLFGKLLGGKPKTITVTKAELPSVQTVNPEDVLGLTKSHADLDGVKPEWLSESKGKIWNLNRSGEARLLGLDPYNRQVRARYDLEGENVVGDGEVPVFLNENGNSQTPFLVVQSFREAVIAYGHYREKHGNTAKVPHVVCALPGVNLASFLPWLPPSPHVFVGHGKREGSLESAKKLGEALTSLNVPFEHRPRIDGPSIEQQASAPATHANAKALPASRPRFS
jgi:ATP-dependent exoDNAse (exonuclease V) alpha subunit